MAGMQDESKGLREYASEHVVRTWRRGHGLVGCGCGRHGARKRGLERGMAGMHDKTWPAWQSMAWMQDEVRTKTTGMAACRTSAGHIEKGLWCTDDG